MDKPITRLRTTVTRGDGTVALEGTAVCYTMPLSDYVLVFAVAERTGDHQGEDDDRAGSTCRRSATASRRDGSTSTRRAPGSGLESPAAGAVRPGTGRGPDDMAFDQRGRREAGGSIGPDETPSRLALRPGVACDADEGRTPARHG